LRTSTQKTDILPNRETGLLCFRKVVTLLELLRAYTEVFVASSYWLAFQMSAAYEGGLDEDSMAVISRHLTELKGECERLNLQITFSLIEDAQSYLTRWDKEGGCPLLYESIQHICDILEKELSNQLFIKINSDRRKFYDEPLSKWMPIITRFASITSDVEEMNKCFALSRYTAAMFHAMQIAEAGAIELGNYISVTDPKRGWDATRRKLQELVNQGHLKLPCALSGKFEFLEQMQREIDSMVMAWRNKIDHTANRLVIIPNTDFTPDIAEHIMGAVRIFMLRLAEGMP
jgi:hypothetical protein